MKMFRSAFCMAILFLAGSLAAQTAVTYTGWISDSVCKEHGANASHKQCAIQCVQNQGAHWVFVNSKGNEVLQIENQDSIHPDADLGHPVSITGHMTDKSDIHVDSIAAAK